VTSPLHTFNSITGTTLTVTRAQELHADNCDRLEELCDWKTQQQLEQTFYLFPQSIQ